MKRLTENYMRKYTKLTNDILLSEYDCGVENAVFSPYSIMILLAMVAHATDGETRDEILRIISGNASLESYLKEIEALTEATSNGILAANAVCVRNDIRDTIMLNYEKNLDDIFEGKLFFGDGLVNDVNDWVNEQSGGFIPTILSDEDEDSLVCFLNAVCFNKKWNNEYSANNLSKKDFNAFNGEKYKIDMLNSCEERYLENDNVIGFKKQYKGAYSFIGLLPKKEGRKALQEAIVNLDIKQLMDTSEEATVIISMPKFRAETSRNLVDFCQENGINRVFSDRAEFSFSSEWLAINKILHKAFIDVNENGTRAAAVTASTGNYGGAPPIFLPYKKVILNRPYIYAIVHDETGIPLFVGYNTKIA